ncbi:uncharacterized protein LOC112345280 [Selaginella moellendorffii]|uniref:uncharacterized protein LOC112345280 n=1 Tax=Selaginella moellendorffii TaxID=88036 RepID=UPI000D1CD736|nr:uncharacterized protein LOC112345280 [Selaginella moellendorffii]|eukprot:XP_024527424.1 uncharacterized protein LOC112345280 [Selaginella moellendorffii]
MAPKPKGEEPPPPPPEEVKEDPKIALRKQIEAQERDIFHLKHLLEALVDGEGHSLRDAKILELFKKNRELNLAYERERNSSSKLKFQVGQLQQEVLKRRNKLYKGNAETLQKTNAEVPEQTNPEVSQQTNPADGVKNAQQQDEQKKSEQPEGQQGEQQGTVEESIQEAKAEIATPEEPWKEKFDQVALKLAEAQSVHTGLTMEVSKLRYALQREVGEHIPVAKVFALAHRR